MFVCVSAILCLLLVCVYRLFLTQACYCHKLGLDQKEHQRPCITLLDQLRASALQRML